MNQQTQIIHRVVLPAAWLVLALAAWQWPGDKGLCFYLGTIIGAWVHELIRVRGMWYLMGQCVGGVPMMFGAAYVMDRMRVGKVVYAACLPLVASAGWAWFGLRDLPSSLMLLLWSTYAIAGAGLFCCLVNALKKRFLHNELMVRDQA